MLRSLFLSLLVFSCGVAGAAEEGKSMYGYLVGKDKTDYKSLYNDVLQRVKVEYVEEVSEKDLVEKSLDGMLSSLDPHSSFLNEKEFNELKNAIKGEIGGIGVEITMDRGFIKVISPYEDGPGFKAGIKIGDYITNIDGQVVKGMTLSDAADRLRGKPKTKVTVTIFRESTSESLEFTITRELIKITPVKSRVVGGDVGLIKVATFGDTTAQQVKKEFAKLVDQARADKKELAGLIIDLRWNPGGIFFQAIELVELFVENGVVVSTKGRMPEANNVYRADGTDVTEGLPIVVLVNGGSASASEIVAGALQDNKRALIVGTKTFGKGSVQSIIPLPDGKTAMKITTSLYYTPSGKSIQAEGIEPDVIVEEALVTPIKSPNLSDEADLVGHLQNEDKNSSQSKSNKKLPSLGKKDSEDFQLLRAIDLVKGMSLYSTKVN